MEEEFSHLTKKEKKALRREQKMEEREKQNLWQNIKRIVIWGVVLIGIGSIILAVIKTSSINPSVSSTTSSINVTASDWFKGDKNAKAVLVEYSDFQCQGCAFYYRIINTLEKEVGDKMLFVYRHFPLPQHKNARLSAYASEAAGNQGKFWEMHSIIFENQKIWSDTDDAKQIFTDYAKSLNLDLTQFEKDLDSVKVKDKVENDLKSGQQLGVNSTPTFYLNGKKLNNIESYEQFKQIIEKEAEKT